MQIVLFDNKQRKKMYPLTDTRAMADLKTGILTNKERWEYISGTDVFILTEDYLQPLYNNYISGDILLIDASVIFTEEQAKKILQIPSGYYISYAKGFIAGRFSTKEKFDFTSLQNLSFDKMIDWKEDVTRIDYPWQIFQQNDTFIRSDFKLITEGRTSNKNDSSNKTIKPKDIFIEDGCNIQHSFLNASTGPIYIGKNVTIMEGCFLRGPLSIGDNSLIKIGAKIYGATSIGSNCVVSGEIKNVVIFNNSNKAHDGYLGDSVIGEWCNLGAGTSNSNLKNNAGEIQVNSNDSKAKIHVGQKCGVIMGDYTKTAINSSINTGSIYGVCCNVFGNGLLPKAINNFSWGENENYKIEKAIDDINNWKKLKNKELQEAEINVLQHLAKIKNKK